MDEHALSAAQSHALDTLGRAAGIEGSLDDVLGEVVSRARDRIATCGEAISLPTLCNGIWLVWDGTSYAGEAAGLLIDALPSITHNNRTLSSDEVDTRTALRISGAAEAPALGSFVQIPVGRDITWAEVIYKEGNHPALDDDYVPGWLSGAPPIDRDPRSGDVFLLDGDEVALYERLVIDDGCFGVPAGAEKLARMRRKDQLDPHGHVCLRAGYTRRDAERSDIDYWAELLVRRHANALDLAGIDDDPEILRQAALGLRILLEADRNVRVHGDYVIDTVVYEACVAEMCGELDVFPAVLGSLNHLPGAEVSFSSGSRRLVELLGTDAVEGRGAMLARRWATVVVAFSIFALDILAIEPYHNIDLRLDDRWQGGGIWRAESVEWLSPLLGELDDPRGTGWAAFSGAVLKRAPETSLDELERVVEELGEQGALDVDDEETEITAPVLCGTEVAWTIVLSGADINGRRLRVPPDIQPYLAATMIAFGQDVLLVRCNLAGDEQRVVCALGEDWHITFSWPPDLPAGTKVTAAWVVNQPLVLLSVNRLEAPVVVEGVEYVYEISDAAVRRERGLLSARPVTVLQLVLAMVRAHGELTDDGRRILGFTEISSLCFGPNGEIVPRFTEETRHRAVVAAAHRLVADGIGQIVRDLLIVRSTTQRVASHPRRKLDHEIRARFLGSMVGRLSGVCRLHWVVPGVVNLPDGWNPSDEKIRGWDEVAGIDGMPSGDLQPGQTWRRGHTRAGGEAAIADELEKIAEALARAGCADRIEEVKDLAAIEVLGLDVRNATEIEQPG